MRLHGFRLRSSGRTCEPIVPQLGGLESEVLGLQLRIEAERLRFYNSDQALPAADDVIETLEAFSDDSHPSADGCRAARGRSCRRAAALEARLRVAFGRARRLKSERRP